MKKRIRIEGEIEWKTFVDDETGFWIGLCDTFQLTASGETHSELVASISELMQMVVTDLLKSGELEEFAQLRGWKLTRHEIPSSDGDDVDVPWRLNPASNAQEIALC